MDRKLARLADLNDILAYKPWILNASNIEQLIKGDEKDNWSVPEILQAGAIMANFHSLCGLVLGLGIIEDLDMAVPQVYEAEENATEAAYRSE